MMARTSMVVVAGLLMASVSHAAVLCTSGSGSGIVRVRVACRPRQVQLDPVALGLQGPPGAPGQQGEPGPQGLPGPGGGVTVRDTNGTVVGAWKAEPANAGQAVVTPSGHAVALPVLPYGFYDSQTVKTYHESADCSGPPLLRDDVVADGGAAHPAFLFVYQGFNLSGTAYYPRALRFSGALGSYDFAGCSACAPFGCSCAPLTTSGGCAAAGGTFTPPGECCFSFTGSASEVVADIGTFDLPTLGLVPPFHVEGP